MMEDIFTFDMSTLETLSQPSQPVMVADYSERLIDLNGPVVQPQDTTDDEDLALTQFHQLHDGNVVVQGDFQDILNLVEVNEINEQNTALQRDENPLKSTIYRLDIDKKRDQPVTDGGLVTCIGSQGNVIRGEEATVDKFLTAIQLAKEDSTEHQRSETENSYWSVDFTNKNAWHQTEKPHSTQHITKGVLLSEEIPLDLNVQIEGAPKKGSHGEVHIGRFGKKRVAIKAIPLQDFQRNEVDAPISLRGKLSSDGKASHILKIHGVVLDGNNVLVIMDFIEQDLESYMYQHLGSVPESTVCSISSQILTALLQLNENDWMHMDIKPQNIGLTQKDGKPHVVLLDYGSCIPCVDGAVNVFHCQPLGMTPKYVAPEVIRTEEVITRASMLYSLGCTMISLCRQEHVWHGLPLGYTRIQALQHILNHPEQLQQLVERCPEKLRPLLRSMVNYDPAGRPSLQQALDHLQDMTRPPPVQQTVSSELVQLLLQLQPLQSNRTIVVRNSFSRQVQVMSPSLASKPRPASQRPIMVRELDSTQKQHRQPVKRIYPSGQTVVAQATDAHDTPAIPGLPDLEQLAPTKSYYGDTPSMTEKPATPTPIEEVGSVGEGIPDFASIMSVSPPVSPPVVTKMCGRAPLPASVATEIDLREYKRRAAGGKGRKRVTVSVSSTSPPYKKMK